MSILPDQFSDLEVFVADWAETFKERYGQRMASTQAELQVFFDAVYPRMDELVGYLDQYPLGELPPRSPRALLHRMRVDGRRPCG